MSATKFYLPRRLRGLPMLTIPVEGETVDQVYYRTVEGEPDVGLDFSAEIQAVYRYDGGRHMDVTNALASSKFAAYTSAATEDAKANIS